MAATKPVHKSGQIVPKSGQYPVVGPRGGKTGEERTCVEGERFPPTPEQKQGFGKLDLTKHRKT